MSCVLWDVVTVAGVESTSGVKMKLWTWGKTRTQVRFFGVLCNILRFSILPYILIQRPNVLFSTYSKHFLKDEKMYYLRILSNSASIDLELKFCHLEQKTVSKNFELNFLLFLEI